MGSTDSRVGRSRGAEGKHTSVGCRNQSTPREPHKGWGAAGRVAQPLWPLGYAMDRCPMGAATLQPRKTAMQREHLGRRGAGTRPGRTMRLGHVVNWGFIEVLHQFGLNKGHLFGAEKPQWMSLQGWLLQAEVSRQAGGTQVMPAHSCFPPGHPCSKSPGGATPLLPARPNLTLAAGFQHGERMLIECLTC